MASLHQQNETYFFRILLERSLKLLKIPRKFTSKCGFNLPNPVFLKPADGTEWKIFWAKSKSDGDIWFQNGWEEFVRHYSLDIGYLVLFKYVESSHFDVLLFDKSTLQIEYPSHVPYNEKPNLDDDHFSDDLVEILSKKPHSVDNSFEILSEKPNSNDDLVEISSEKPQFCDDPIEIFNEKPQSSDDSDKNLSEKPSHSKTKMKSPLLSPRPQKKLKVGTNGDFEPSSSLKSSHFHVQTEGRQSQGKTLEKSSNGNAHVKSTKKELEEDMRGNAFTNNKCPKSEEKTRKQTITDSNKKEALKRAKNFRSENPFFIVIIQPSYISTRSSLYVPIKFADEHLEKKEGSLILEDLKGTTWSATYNGRRILSGWHKFTRDNDLKVGDACVFEMTNSIELSFKILIYRAHEDPSCSFSSQGKKLKPKVPRMMPNTMKNEALRKAMSAEFPNPFFKIVMQNTCVSCRPYLRVPIQFIKKYFNDINNTVLVTLRRVDGRLWSVKYTPRLYQGRTYYEFHRGWKQFVVDNNLKVGDVCVFELIDRIKITFDVTIFRDTKDGAHKMYSAQGTKADSYEPEIRPETRTKSTCTSKVKSEKPELSDQFRSQVKFGRKIGQRMSTLLLKHGGKRVLQKVKEFGSDNPHFTVCIKPCYVDGGKPFLPKDFYMSFITEREKNVLIQVGERSWHAKMICHWRVSSAKFSAGWPAFARENNLQVGDVCIFELINRDDAVLEAHIFRHHS
ncbi:hypothetical protein L6164_026522 [Bauhinia variegata]|uniref:Uncharacterized protein n=1 Tax=Bauhinia variegata TaxID=167791 RepID=A0ACB9LQK7_BAUVA|nr:hypothetical protein L6164_026522 [Bauhinia variegata]